MLKAVFFDLDNTLYDYDSADKIAEKALYDELHKYTAISFEEFKFHYKQAKEEVKRELIGMAASHNRILYIQNLTERVHKTINAERILDLYDAYWNTLLENAKLFDGALETFKFLQSRGVRMALVTNLTAHIQLRKIRALGISDYVDFLVTSEEAGYDKPHPATLLLALHKVNLLPEDVAMVGDTLESDIEGCEALNMTSILYKFGDYPAILPVKPDHIVDSHAELKKLLEEKLA